MCGKLGLGLGNDKKLTVDQTQILKFFSLYHMQIPNRLDATSSVFQITSFLTKNIQLASSTNVMCTKDHQIKDFYTIVFNNFKEWILKEEISFLKKVIKLDSEKHAHIINLIKFLFSSNCAIISRKTIKSILMPYLYGISIINVIDKIREELTLTITDKVLSQYNSSESSIKVLLTKNLIDDMSIFLAKAIFYFIEHYYGSIPLIKKILATIGAIASHLQLPIQWELSCTNTTTNCSYASVFQKYVIFNKIKINTLNSKQYRKKGLSHTENSLSRTGFQTNIPTKFPCAVKTAQSLPANVVHSIDSTILYILLFSYYKNHTKFPVYSVHDCLAITWLHSSEVSSLYLEALSKVLDKPEFVFFNLFHGTFNDILQKTNLKVPTDTNTNTLCDFNKIIECLFSLHDFLCTDKNKNFIFLDFEQQALFIKKNALIKKKILFLKDLFIELDKHLKENNQFSQKVLDSWEFHKKSPWSML